MSRGEAARRRRSRAEGVRRASESARGLWASESETFIYLFILPFVSGRVALVCGRGRQLRCPSDSLALRALPLAQGPSSPRLCRGASASWLPAPPWRLPSPPPARSSDTLPVAAVTPRRGLPSCVLDLASAPRGAVSPDGAPGAS